MVPRTESNCGPIDHKSIAKVQRNEKKVKLDISLFLIQFY